MERKITINIDEDTYKQLRYFSFEKGTTMSQIIRRGIIEIMKTDFKPTLDKVSKIIDGHGTPKKTSENIEEEKNKKIAEEKGSMEFTL